MALNCVVEKHFITQYILITEKNQKIQIRKIGNIEKINKLGYKLIFSY